MQKAKKQQTYKVRKQSNVRPRDIVLLSIKHLILKARPRKLLPQYIKLFKVLPVIGCNTAKLELPPAMKVHSVFIMALLKKY